jgi:hypothetical protein
MSLVMVIGLSAGVIRAVIAVNMGLLITEIIVIAMYLWTAIYTETTTKSISPLILLCEIIGGLAFIYI